jgi:hypothetical protein
LRIMETSPAEWVETNAHDPASAREPAQRSAGNIPTDAR